VGIFRRAPVVLYANLVPDVTLSLSGGNSIGDEGATALAAGLKDSSLSKLNLSTLSAAAIFGALHERPASALRYFRRSHVTVWISFRVQHEPDSGWQGHCDASVGSSWEVWRSLRLQLTHVTSE
jgi:hypothetical protein